jgi:sugar (pentulose or hexulose) kinase
MNKTINCSAIDLGASHGKVTIGSFDGDKVRLKEVFRFTHGPVEINNSIYWDVLRLFEKVKKGLGTSHKEYGAGLSSIALDAWGNDFCLLDRDGNLVENPHSYRDPRTDGIMNKSFEMMPREEIYRRTGVQFMQHNTLFQLYSMVLAGSPLLNTASTYLMTADLFNFWMTGEKYCEFTNATTTQFFDPFTNSWCKPILDKFNIPSKIMPPIVMPGTMLGTLSDWLCNDLNIPHIPVIAIGSHDTASAASAVPAKNGDYAFLSSGTWSLMGAEVDKPLVSDAGLQHNFSCYGGVCGKYLVWKNIQALWVLQECQRVWEEQGITDTFEGLLMQAEKAAPFKALIDVDDRSFLTPGDFPAVIAGYCKRTGQQPPETRAEIVRCILESLALKYRYTFERLQLVMGRKLGRIHIVGGGSRNGLLNRFTSEATGVQVIAGPAEATSLGNIMLQLITLGEAGSLEQSREIISRSFNTVTYEAKTSRGWEEAYGRFLKLLDGNRI